MSALLALVFGLLVILASHLARRHLEHRSVIAQSQGYYGRALNLEDMGLGLLCTAYFCAGILVASVVLLGWVA